MLNAPGMSLGGALLFLLITVGGIYALIFLLSFLL